MNDFFFLFCLQVRPIFLIYGMEEYVMVDGEKKFCSATLSEYLWIIFMFMAAWTSSFFLVWASIFAYFSELTFWHQRTCLTTILVWKTSHIKRTIFFDNYLENNYWISLQFTVWNQMDYSSDPNKRAGTNKCAGWNFVKN